MTGFQFHGAGNAHSFRNTPFAEFMILLIRYTYMYTCTLCITEFGSLRTMFTD